jgi:hypothetical protein
MWAIIKNDEVEQVVINPVPITIGDVRHPPNIFSQWSEEEKKKEGIYKLFVKTADERFWEIHGTTYEIDHEQGHAYETPVKEAKNIQGIKSYLINEIQERAYVILVQSDWMVLRAWETKGKKPIPVELVEYRDQVREVADRKVIEVGNLNTVEELEEYSLNDGWPVFVQKPPYSRIQVLEAERQRIEEMIEKRRRIAALIAIEGLETSNENEALNED